MGYLAQYLSHFDELLNDTNLIEIAINPDGRVWIEAAGDVHMNHATEMSLTPDQVSDLAHAIANDSKQTLTEKSPIVSTTVAYGDVSIRVQIINPPAIAGGSVISMRLFHRRQFQEPKKFRFLGERRHSSHAERATLLASIKSSAGSEDEDRFLQRLIDARMNVIISGGTSSGKTELGRRLLWMVPECERLVTIEDALELMPSQPNVVSLLSSRAENSPRSADILLQASLRLRPDRIVVGELRGSEAATFLQAINTGHGGSFTTIHADTAPKAITRLALMVMETGIRLPYAEVIRYLEGSIDVVVQTGKDGTKRGIREVYFPGTER